jgi:hypothetical protein
MSHASDFLNMPQFTIHAVAWEGTALRLICAAPVLLMLAACSGKPPADTVAPTPVSSANSPAVERHRLPDAPAPSTSSAASDSPSPAALPAIVLPPGSLYVCVVDSGAVRKQTAIEFAPKVAALCAKAPEMGPCQYERNACRHSGGRVYAADGVEITMQTEAEYDKKVLRVRLNGG